MTCTSPMLSTMAQELITAVHRDRPLLQIQHMAREGSVGLCAQLCLLTIGCVWTILLASFVILQRHFLQPSLETKRTLVPTVSMPIPFLDSYTFLLSLGAKQRIHIPEKELYSIRLGPDTKPNVRRPIHYKGYKGPLRSKLEAA